MGHGEAQRLWPPSKGQHFTLSSTLSTISSCPSLGEGWGQQESHLLQVTGLPQEDSWLAPAPEGGRLSHKPAVLVTEALKLCEMTSSM